MYFHSAKTAIGFLTAHTTDRADAMTEAEYFAACGREEARRSRRSPARIALAALYATPLVQWIVTGPAHRQDKAGLGLLLRSDPRMLRDLGICTTGFGGFVLEEAEGQSMDLLAAIAPAPVPVPEPVLDPEPTPIRPLPYRTALPAFAPA